MTSSVNPFFSKLGGMDSKPRVLGAQRTLTDAVSSVAKSEVANNVIAKVNAGSKEDLPISDLELALAWYANHNSNYTNVDEDEFHTLVDEVLNNSIRSVLVFAELSSAFGDAEVYCLSLAFQYNLSVEALTLSSVNSGDESMSMLCEALVHSRVNYIDLTNTLLEDEAGRSLAALAHVNPHLRTVIIGDTLISEDVLDEIDVACQFNQSNYEGNNNAVEEDLFKVGSLGRLKQRMNQIIRSKSRKIHFCVAHLFGYCPNGDMCLLSHTLSSGGIDDARESLSAKITKLFSSGGNWEERMPPRPQEGASWRNPDEGVSEGPRLNMKKRREILRQKEEARARSSGTAQPTFSSAALVVGVTAVAAAVVTVILGRLRRSGS